LTDHIGLGVVSARFDRDLLEEVLNQTGRKEKRSRRLPAHVVIRCVIAMGLFAAESYDEVMRRLVGNLRRLGSWDDDRQVPTKSAITQARQRLGAEPMKALFERAAVLVAGPGAKGAWLARRRLMVIDAVSFGVADTRQNVERSAGWARVRKRRRIRNCMSPLWPNAAATLLSARCWVAAALGNARWPPTGPGMLVVADAGLYSFELFNTFAATGADLAWRIGASVSVGLLRWLPDGSYHALIYAPSLSAARGHDWSSKPAQDRTFPPRWPAWYGWSSTRFRTAIPTVT
jgi:hypothetical protein